MALSQKKMQQWGILGALSAVIMQFIITYIFPYIPKVGITFSSYVLNIRQHVSGVNTTLGDWVLGLFNQSITLPSLVITAIGGALFMIVVAYLMDSWKVKIKDKTTRLAVYIGVTSLIVGVIVSGVAKIPTMSMLLSVAVNSYVVALLIRYLDNQKILKIPA